MATKTTEMSPELRAELARLGWTPERVATMVWGRRVSGDMHGTTIERNGVIRHIAGPFSAVRGGDQIAIVRF